MSPLATWQNFYVVVGSAAGALTGLTFVVITLTPERRTRDMDWGISTFTTPTVVHFSVVLFVAALLSAPWPALWQAALALGLCALGGLSYGAIVLRRIRRRGNYEPVREDWLFFVILPLAAYGSLLVAALLLTGNSLFALFLAGGALLLMLFVGIHNAWDVVTYMAVAFTPEAQSSQDADKADDADRAG